MKKLAAESLNYEPNKEYDYGFKQEGLDKKNKIIFIKYYFWFCKIKVINF